MLSEVWRNHIKGRNLKGVTMEKKVNMDNEDLAKRLLEAYESSNKQKQGLMTFLSVLGRTYDEDLISRVLAYALHKDKGFAKQLVENYLKEFSEDRFDITALDGCELQVTCEKYMVTGRADVFVEFLKKGKNSTRAVATVTIENKIYSEEHDDQTTKYYEWVTKKSEYKNSYNTFFYLRPSFNKSEAVNVRYVNIIYTDMLVMITEDDYIINDFKEHIINNLGEKSMDFNNDEKFLIDYYAALNGLISDTKKKYKEYQNEIIEDIKANFFSDSTDYSNGHISTEEATYEAGIGSFRLYRNEWNNADHYFYVEIKFHDGGMNKITYQITLWNKSKQKGKDCLIERFIASQSKYNTNGKDGQYYIVKAQPYENDGKDWTTEGWKDDFINKSVKTLKDYIKEMDEIYNAFREYVKATPEN